MNVDHLHVVVIQHRGAKCCALLVVWLVCSQGLVYDMLLTRSEKEEEEEEEACFDVISF